MWSMMAMKKGTSMKDKKKRAGGGSPPPSTGTYPDNFSGSGITVQLGVGSSAVQSVLAPSPNLHASVFYRDGVATPSGSFLQVTNAGGVNANSQGLVSFIIADYVATALRGETPLTLPSGAMNAPAQPGVIYVPNVVGQSIGVSLLFQTIGVDNGSNAWNGGTATVSAVVNTASLTVSGTLSDSMSGNPPGQQNYLTVNIDTTGLTSPSEIILEFRVQANSKVLGPQTTTQASASDITNGSALKVGSCYVKVVFP